MLPLRFARQIRHIGSRHMALRRLSYGGSAPHAGGQDNSSFFTLLGLAGVIGGVAYVYYDPDVLPTSVKKWLPIQEPEGRGMSLEEYEQWRAKQAGFPTVVTQKKEEEKAKPAHSKEEEDVEPPNVNDDIPIPHGDVSPMEMKASLEKLLAEARENEAAFIADIKSNRVPVSEEDRQMLQAFKDEKARLKKQLKFLKSNK
ncbi:hypothetical protein PC116_g18981 [Phytophthora cactorum]|uniref:Uncharacterized protein n=1 Tax=Phytophthora cactorum TaxID=29920 RepID=A0A329RV59_9STRA|nr:hypothetical protein Pcac1_g23300 [Phytophthora cactorum]KAG2894368.1 hypothetical protein PC114_g15933 [Phytophthora cactorum]KAG2924202.1 hypothetical protein PC117_g15435 [Phytophthora cactorum]KAG3010570.1 hypothetical protein PC120_g14989 [Phytophthora cactorum]KAG3074168.1 hypothetical protein PC122_g14500 [Phytophthora cactorum]